MTKIKRAVVGVDFSPRSIAAARMTVELVGPVGARIDLVNVLEAQIEDYEAKILGKSKSELMDLLAKEADAAFEAVVAQLNYDNIGHAVLTGNPAVELAGYCAERNADLLVVGDTGSEEQLTGVGATAYTLVERGPRRVLVTKVGRGERISSVAVAISFVPVADELFRQACSIARATNAELHVVHAIPDITGMRYRLAYLYSSVERLISESMHHNEKRLEEFIAQYDTHGLRVKRVVLFGKAGPSLVDYLQRESIDLVVLGTGTSWRLAGLALGSTTHRVLNQTLSSVFIVRSLQPPP